MLGKGGSGGDAALPGFYKWVAHFGFGGAAFSKNTVRLGGRPDACFSTVGRLSSLRQTWVEVDEPYFF